MRISPAYIRNNAQFNHGDPRKIDAMVFSLTGCALGAEVPLLAYDLSERFPAVWRPVVCRTKPSQEALEDCDTLLMVGTSFPYIESYPKPGRAKGVQIEIDPMRVGLRYPVEVGLVGDSCRTLHELLPMLKRKEDRKFQENAQKGINAWNEFMEKRGTRPDKPMRPKVVAWELGKRLSDDAIVSRKLLNQPGPIFLCSLDGPSVRRCKVPWPG